MKKDVVTIGEDATVQELAKLLAGKKISGAPVVDRENRMIGIISEDDLVALDTEIHFPHYIELLGNIVYLESVTKYEERLKNAAAGRVGDIMTREVVTVPPDATIPDMATLMEEREVHRLPVVEGDQLVGIVTRADIVRSLARG